MLGARPSTGIISKSQAFGLGTHANGNENGTMTEVDQTNERIALALKRSPFFLGGTLILFVISCIAGSPPSLPLLFSSIIFGSFCFVSIYMSWATDMKWIIILMPVVVGTGPPLLKIWSGEIPSALAYFQFLLAVIFFWSVLVFLCRPILTKRFKVD